MARGQEEWEMEGREGKGENSSFLSLLSILFL